MDMTLEEQIRRVLIFTGKTMHPEDIRRLVFDNRPYLGIKGKRQSIKTFKRVMQAMPDVVTLYESKTNTWKRRLTRKTHEECFTDLKKRVRLWLQVMSCRVISRTSDFKRKLRR